MASSLTMQVDPPFPTEPINLPATAADEEYEKTIPKEYQPPPPKKSRKSNGVGKRAPRIELGDITPNNIGTLKALNRSLFPVEYSARWYESILRISRTGTSFDPDKGNWSEAEFCKLVYYNDVPVGCITARLEPTSVPLPSSIASTTTPESSQPNDPATPSEPNGHQEDSDDKMDHLKLYIMTLGVLAPYRRLGLGTRMVRHVIRKAEETHKREWFGNGVLTTFGASSDQLAKIDGKGKGDDKKGGAKKGTTKEDEKKKKNRKRRVVDSMHIHVQVSNEEAKSFWDDEGLDGLSSEFESEDESDAPTPTQATKDEEGEKDKARKDERRKRLRRGFRLANGGNAIEGYYKKVEPRGAWLLERRVGPKAREAGEE